MNKDMLSLTNGAIGFELYVEIKPNGISLVIANEQGYA